MKEGADPDQSATIKYKHHIRLRADVFFMDKIYIELSIRTKDASEADLLIGLLSGIGYDGFREEDDLLVACIERSTFDPEMMRQTLPEHTEEPVIREIREENWNALWESSFDPVVIPGRLSVRADFHQPVPDVQREIIITPKMSFGTGHHATTSLMLEEMLDISFSNLDVLDFGTGTGVLAILAEQLGAREVIAIDNDPWSIENSRENAVVNQCTRIELVLSDQLPEYRTFDVILANINRNVILANADKLSNLLKPGGRLLLSGLLVSDQTDIVAAFQQRFQDPSRCREKNGWIVLIY
jgi:ribosomal protein L11 methyltransferase